MGDVANLVPARAGEPGPALKHGAYSVIKLAPRAREIRSDLEERLPLRSDADSAIVDLLAVTLAQVERAMLVLTVAEHEETEAVRNGRTLSRDKHATLQRLSADARGWVGRAERLLDAVGLNPHSRVRLGLEVAQQQSAVEALHDYLRAKRAATRDG